MPWPRRYCYALAIAGRDKNIFSGVNEKNFFRHYDPNKKELTFYQKPYNLEEIVKEVKKNPR